MSDDARAARYIHDAGADAKNADDVVSKVEAEIEKLTSPEKKKAAAAVAIAALIAAGGTAAAEAGVDYTNVPQPIPIVQDIDELYAVDDSADKSVTAEVQDTKSQSIAKTVLAPIYAAGAAVSHFISVAIGALSMPVIGPILQFLLLAAVVLGSLALTLKIAFPDIPLGKMLTPKRIGLVLVGVAVVSAACEVIPMAAPETEMYVEIFKYVAGFGIVLPFFVAIFKVVRKVKGKLGSVIERA